MLALLLTFIQMSLASPHPLAGSSIVNKPYNNLAFAQMGFRINSVPESWVFNKPLDSSNSEAMELGPAGKTLLSLRLETVSSKTNLEQYVRRYLRDYNQYGFTVSGLQSLQNGRTPSVIVDLNQKNKATRSRQVFFNRQNKLIIATCTDESAKFDATVALCNQILGTFEWR